jgi:hypothetical protein
MSRSLTFACILFEQILINSRVQFRANSENLHHWLYWSSVCRLACLVRMTVTLAHISLPPSIWTGDNQLTGSIPGELVELTLLDILWLGTCIDLSCWHDCDVCSHLLAILFDQVIINSRVQFRAHSENLLRWLSCGSVRGLVCLVAMNVTLAHICLPFCLNRL